MIGDKTVKMSGDKSVKTALGFISFSILAGFIFGVGFWAGIVAGLIGAFLARTYWI